jgi:hypothetical protein
VAASPGQTTANVVSFAVPFYLKQLAENEDGTGPVVKEPFLDGRQHLELPWRPKGSENPEAIGKEKT